MTVVTESLQPEQENALNDEPTQDDTASEDTATPLPDRLVPVAEAIRYRKRAQLAEQRLGELERELADAQQRCETAEQSVTSLERRQRIDQLLSEQGAVDLEAARLLTEAAVQAMDEGDVAAAVDDLRRHKPYLFHPRADTPAGLALSPRIDGVDDPMARAAEQAQQTGDRRDLLRYLRLRRRP